MAHKATISSEDLKNMLDGVSHFWNVTGGVGWGYDNRREDVLLIQYLLNSIAGASLVEDGIFGKKTQKAIRAFQKIWGGRCVVDGKVNTVDGTTAWIEGSSFAYTIYYLNAEYLGQRPLFYADLKMDPKLPSDLCHILKPWNVIYW